MTQPTAAGEPAQNQPLDPDADPSSGAPDGPPLSAAGPPPGTAVPEGLEQARHVEPDGADRSWNAGDFDGADYTGDTESNTAPLVADGTQSDTGDSPPR